MVTAGSQLLIVLSTIVTLGALLAYRSILSSEAAYNYVANLADAPPPLRGYHGVVSGTVRDAPQGKFHPPVVTHNYDDDGGVGGDDGIPEMARAIVRPAGLGGIVDNGGEKDEDAVDDASDSKAKVAGGGDVDVDVDGGDDDDDDNNVDDKSEGDNKGNKVKRRRREKKRKNDNATDDDEEEAAAVLKAKDISIRIKNFKALDPPKVVLAVSATRAKEIDFDSIADKWELPKSTIVLLKQIHSRTVAFDYNRTTDILSLRHPLKTGGTSFSRMLEQIFPGQTVPGSGFSNWWQQDRFDKAMEKHPNPDDPYWTNMVAFYTHTFLRPGQGGRKNNLLEDLREWVPAFREKRFRLMTIVRRPLDLAASSFYETQCRIGTFAKQRAIKDVKDCPPVNLTDVMQKNIDHWVKKCKSDERPHQKCTKMEEKGLDKVFEHCGSIEKLFEKGSVHNMMHESLMGDFPRPPELGDDKNLIGENLTPSMEDVTTYTLRDLGGLIDYHPKHKEDFVWFAITERFSESMCLFYYRFEIDPVEEKRSLHKPCRPLTFWKEDQKKTHIQNEDFDYHIWRAANAILDVRMEDMRLEIKARIAAGEKLKDIPYLGPECYNDKA